MMILAEKGLLPHWCLFCFKEVTTHHDPDYKPNILALIASDAILIHPVKNGSAYEGLLIALETASEQRRVFTSEKGQTVTLKVPNVNAKVIAQEGVTLFS